MSNRELNQKIAEETIAILDKGFYQIGKDTINISSDVQKSIQHSILYRPDAFSAVQIESKNDYRTKIEVVNETTLTSAKRLVDLGYDNVACLNFASAKNPGGGFLNGSLAQEESLARSSALYPCILQMKEMYEYNKRVGTCLYSDYMVYSPSVPVIRNDKGNLIQPYKTSIITSPSVNAKVVKERESQNVSKIVSVMRERIDKILTVALLNNADALVLGAYGCGVFDNNPNDVAKLFQEHLFKNEKFKNQFKHISFAVLDTSPQKQLFNIFRYGFGR
jgi:uncharacterized protein (TIGR02452 family)